MIERAVLPTPGFPGARCRRRLPRRRPLRCQRRGARSSCCATRTSPSTPTPKWSSRASLITRLAAPRADAGLATHPAGQAASHAPDVRRVIASSLRTGGEPLHRHWRAPSRRPRPVVLRVRRVGVDDAVRPDAAPISARVGRRHAGGWRRSLSAPGLTRITNELSGRDHDVALERASARSPTSPAAPDRSRARRAQPDARAPDRARRGGRGAVGRMGPGRSRDARLRDGAAAAERPPPGVAEPARLPP